MRTTKTLRPGQRGTKDLQNLYGASLLCVRYRYDAATGESLKTVELVVQRRSGEREAECPASLQSGGRASPGCCEPKGSAPRRLAGRDLRRRIKNRVTLSKTVARLLKQGVEK